MFGEAYKKPTKLATWQPTPGQSFLQCLQRSCDGQHEHVHLSGWNRDRQKNKSTKGTQQYPNKLVNAWVRAAKQHIARL